MKPALFTIARAGPGRPGMMAIPRGGDWLDEETRALAEYGVNAIVSLLADSEVGELGLGGETEAATGIVWVPGTLSQRRPFRLRRSWLVSLVRRVACAAR